MENDFLTTGTNKKLDLVFAEDPSKLLMNIRTHLENENIRPTSLKIVKEYNNFCAVIVGEVHK